MNNLIFFSLIGGLFSLLGGLLLIWKEELAKKILTPLMAFAAGAFLGATSLDLIPEALEMVEEPHPVLMATLIGFLLFFTLERFLMRYFYHSHSNKHEHAEHTESLPFLLILGDSIHNFLDGIVIGLAFLADPTLGFSATLAIAAHEIPQEIGDFSILLNQGWSKAKIIAVNVAQSLLTLPGALLGFYGATLFENSLPYLLAGTAGIFLYLGASDLIPELHHRAGHRHFGKVLIPMLLSILLIGYLVNLAHHA